MTDPASGGLSARALVYLKRTRKCSYLCIFVNYLFFNLYICIFQKKYVAFSIFLNDGYEAYRVVLTH